MAVISDQNSALKLVRRVLAADCACAEDCFEREGVFFFVDRKVEGARKFPLREDSLVVTTMGAGEVVNCSAGRLRWAKRNLSGLGRSQLLFAPALARMNRYVSRDGQVMAGPDLKHICTKDTFSPCRVPADIDITVIREEETQELYSKNLFPNALGYLPSPERPRKVTAVARHDGNVVGVAAASADSDEMWQIGVDALPQYRGRGVGKAVVSRLTTVLFEMGILPYYSTAIANLASRRLAISIGYRPAWVEVYAREKTELARLLSAPDV